MEKSLPSYPREPFLNVKKRPLYLQTMVFTPLSIRRGVGGEAVPYLQTIVFTPLSIRRGVGGEAFPYLYLRSLYPKNTYRMDIYSWVAKM